MIELLGVDAKGKGTPRPTLVQLSARWERGLHGVVGAPLDGTSLLLSVIAGRQRIKRGQVAIDGSLADQGRLDVMHVPLDPVLPEALCVGEVLALAAAIRGEAPATLAPLGLSSLNARRVGSLGPAELRAVAFALAIGSNAATLLLEEPFAHLAPSVPSRIAELLAARAKTATILVTTASVRDAVALGASISVITRGRLQAMDEGLAFGGQLRLRVATAADSLVRALGADAAIETVDARAYGTHTALTVTGADAISVANAVGRAAALERIDIEVLESSTLPLDAIRARLGAGTS